MPKLAPPTPGALKAIDGVCRYLHRQYIAPQDREVLSVFALRTYREAAFEKIQSDPEILSDWLQRAIDGVRQGIRPRYGSEQKKALNFLALDGRHAQWLKKKRFPRLRL